MDYRIWAALGVILLIAELHTLTFVLAILGAAAIITALVTKTGLTAGADTQCALFSAVSLVLIYVLRGRIRKRPALGAIPPDYQGQKVRVVKPIPADGEGSVFYRGAKWIAFSNEPIEAGSMVQIVGSDGIRLRVCLNPEIDN